MLDFNTLLPIYDFSLIEKAVQDFFVALPTGDFQKPPGEDDPTREQWQASGTPFFTPTEALMMQMSRPRIGILETNFSEAPAHILDADGNYRASGWKAVIKMAIITEPQYKLHRALRGAVMAIIPQLQPNMTGDVSATGINQYLKYHEVGQFVMQSGDTAITPAQGAYVSTLSINLTFSVRATAWPGGTLTK